MVTLLNPKVIVDFGELLQSEVILSDDLVKLLKQRDALGETALPEGATDEPAAIITAGRKE
jgi:hypothetical protein